jgi:fluoride exporter
MKQMLLRCIAVGLAGSVGAVARYLIAFLFSQFNARDELGIFFINITGSLFLGWFLAHRNIPDTLRLAIATGFVGAYTTFSTYMWQSNRLIQDGAIYAGLFNLFGSLLAGIIAVRCGIWLAQWA